MRPEWAFLVCKKYERFCGCSLFFAHVAESIILHNCYIHNKLRCARK